MLEVIIFLLPSFAASVVILLILGYLGMHVLDREIIFIDIALAQISAVGAVFAHVVFGVSDEGFGAYIAGFLFTLGAAVFFSQIPRRISQIPQEAIIGVSYAIAAAAALFILALAAGGDVHLENMLTGSILWAKWPDVLICGVLFGGVAVFHYIFRKQFLQMTLCIKNKQKPNHKMAWWDFAFYASMGLVITFAVRIAGVLVIFAFLIIPATIACLMTSNWLKRLLVGWSMGLFAILLGLMFSFFGDFSCGPSIVTFLGLLLIAAALLGKRKTERTQE